MSHSISTQRLLFCLRQVGVRVGRGDSLQDAVAKLEHAAESNYKQEITAINALLQQGSLPTLGVTQNHLLAALNKIFGIVREHHGDLQAAFVGVYELFLQNPKKFNKQIAESTGLMSYLIGVVAVALITASIYLIYVLPEMETVFHNFGAELPRITGLLLSVSRGYAGLVVIPLLLLIAFPVFGLQQLRRKIARLQHVHGVAVHVPLLGRAATEYNRYLSLCLLRIFRVAGLSDQQSVDLLKQHYGYVLSQNNAAKEADSAIAVSMKLGTFDDELQYQLTQHESYNDEAFNNFKDIVSIVSIVVAACVVGALVLAMYLPIFQIGKLVG